MKALVYHGRRDLRWQEWPDPHADPAGVVVRVRAVGICGSDIHGYTGASGRRTPPLVMGHEFAGDVIKVGAEASEWRGRRVVVRPFMHCSRCEACASGHQNLCRNRRFIGVTLDGGMAEQVAAPVSNLIALDPGVDFETAALTEPLAVAIHAIAMAGDIAGRTLLICGGGTLGLLCLVAARRAGAARIVVTDLLAERREAAMRLGAHAAVDAAGDVALHGFDFSIDAVGADAAFQQAVRALRPGGILIALAGWRATQADLPAIVAGELVVRGSFNFKPEEFSTACAWLEAGIVDAGALIRARYPLPDGAAVFEALADARLGGVKAMLVNEV